MRPHGWVGLLIMLAGEALLYAGVPLVATFFTPLMWTGYIVLVDGWVAARTGSSWLVSRRREFGFLVLLSVLSWMLFEVYNFKLANWAYVGMPAEQWLRDLGFLWSFATITPAMFETADALAAFRRPECLWPELARLARSPSPTGTRKDMAAWLVLGLASVTVPPALPAWLAPYTFGLIWVGFIFLLEPVLLNAGQPSMLRLWRTGQRQVIGRWLAAGFICGFLWELWNVQSLAHGGAGWLYTMPSLIHNLVFGLHYGKMPVAGLLGFPPFALESFALYYFLRWVLRLELFLPAVEQYAQ